MPYRVNKRGLQKATAEPATLAVNCVFMLHLNMSASKRQAIFTPQKLKELGEATPSEEKRSYDMKTNC